MPFSSMVAESDMGCGGPETLGVAVLSAETTVKPICSPGEVRGCSSVCVLDISPSLKIRGCGIGATTCANTGWANKITKNDKNAIGVCCNRQVPAVKLEWNQLECIKIRLVYH